MSLPASDREFVYELEIVGGARGYFTIERETLSLREGGHDHQLIIRDENGRWLVNVDSI